MAPWCSSPHFFATLCSPGEFAAVRNDIAGNGTLETFVTTVGNRSLVTADQSFPAHGCRYGFVNRSIGVCCRHLTKSVMRRENDRVGRVFAVVHKSAARRTAHDFRLASQRGGKFLEVADRDRGPEPRIHAQQRLAAVTGGSQQRLVHGHVRRSVSGRRYQETPEFDHGASVGQNGGIVDWLGISWIVRLRGGALVFLVAGLHDERVSAHRNVGQR